MPHFPVNHPLGGFYRGLAVAVAALMIVYPLVFSDNGAFAVVMVVLAVPVLLGVFLSRRRQHYLHEAVGAVLIVLGLAGLAVLRSRYNYLDLNVSACVAMFLFGTALITAGMYTKTGSATRARAEEAYRHSSQGRVAEPAKVLSAPHTRAEELAEEA